MDIIQKPILKNNSICYFIVPNVDYPFIYTRYKGIIEHRLLNDDKIEYYVSVLEILEDIEFIKEHIHNSKQRIFYRDSIGRVKNIKIFDLLSTYRNMEKFNKGFSKKYKDCLFMLPSVFVYSTKEEVDKYFNKSNKILLEHTKKMMKVLESR